jgi:hypothetical protein
MKILLLNPNTTAAVTELLHAAAAPVVSPGTELVMATAPRGVPYIATRAEAQIGGAIALEMLAAEAPDVDAAVIAAFGDPGLFGARELFDIPVVGLAEAAMLTAFMLGQILHRDIRDRTRPLVPGMRQHARPRWPLRQHSHAGRFVPLDLRCAGGKGRHAGAAREQGGRGR